MYKYNCTFTSAERNNLLTIMNSEVERNQKLILVDDILYYTDDSNSEKFTVVGLFNGGFFATDSEGKECSYLFAELQLGWEISEKTKLLRTGERHFRYV
jgi:hypothetical protein